MASGHSTDDSPSDPDRTHPTSPEADATPQDERTSSTDKLAEALAAAAETSELAKRVRDRSTEQAIDKPTQDFGRKRSSSVSSMAQEKATMDRHESGGGPLDLRPLTPANLSSSSHDQDTDGSNGTTLQSADRFSQQSTMDSASLSNALKSPFEDPAPGRFYRVLRPICMLLEKLDFKISRKAWRLFEICDWSWIPNTIR